MIQLQSTSRHALLAAALCAMFCVALPSLAHNDAPAGAAQQAAAPEAAPAAGWAALSARYRVSAKLKGQVQSKSSQIWTLARAPQQISIVKPNVEDIWWCDGQGSIGLKRVLRSDRHIIEYAPGELRALEVNVGWDALATVFDEALLTSMKRVSQIQRQGRPIQRFTGTLHAEQVDLEWDAGLRLPIKLTRRGAAGSVQYELLEQHAVAPANWPVAGAGTEDFTRLDAADFGDMEYNPVVRKAMAMDVRAGWRAEHMH